MFYFPQIINHRKSCHLPLGNEQMTSHEIGVLDAKHFKEWTEADLARYIFPMIGLFLLCLMIVSFLEWIRQKLLTWKKKGGSNG